MTEPTPSKRHTTFPIPPAIAPHHQRHHVFRPSSLGFLTPPPYYTPPYLVRELSCIKNWSNLNRTARRLDPRPEDATNSRILSSTLVGQIQQASDDLAIACEVGDSATIRQLGAFILAASELIAARLDEEADEAARIAFEREERFAARRAATRASRDSEAWILLFQAVFPIAEPRSPTKGRESGWLIDAFVPPTNVQLDSDQNRNDKKSYFNRVDLP
ncbi:hypothetical protein P7C70_g1633, partial [Phenoliferia sp. Uapishka_3]